jgi:hypothetical protein
MASEQPSPPAAYEPSYRQEDVDKTLEDHERRITRNERWRLILKGAIAGLAMATATDQGIGYLIQFL